ncbi:MAG: hypothetical protein KY396_08875, partial [Actinobacteria bacterium]|nr:hypothetical protein [Actinomycetota bacterium]
MVWQSAALPESAKGPLSVANTVVFEIVPPATGPLSVSQATSGFAGGGAVMGWTDEAVAVVSALP